MPNIRRFIAVSIALLSTAYFITGCSNDNTTGPTVPAAAAAKGAPGGGGGGTAVPPTPVPTAQPTLDVTGPSFTPLSDRPLTLSLIATSEGNNRKAPIVTVSNTPAGFIVINSVSIDSPHGGGPGHVIASYSWTPTRAQIGLVAQPRFIATTSGGSDTVVATLAAVQDAPTPITGLTAVVVGDHIEARWQPVTGGVNPITYSVSACYRNANIRPSAATCDLVATTTAPQVLDIPVANPSPTVAPSGGVATYFTLLITAQDAAGVQGNIATVNVQ